MNCKWEIDSLFVLKILSGPQAGKTISLDKSEYILGRSPQSDIVIQSAQVSKKHAKIQILGKKIVLKDLKSRNGTYINGVQIREDVVQLQDKITLHNIVIVIQKKSARQTPNNAFQGNLALKQDPSEHMLSEQDYGNPEEAQEPEKKPSLENYIEDVVLSGFYKFTEWMEFNWLIAIVVSVLILICTALSSIPAVNLLKSSIEKESQRRALSIAKNMVSLNKNFVVQNYNSSINLDAANQEAGVVKAIIVDKNGATIAPSSQAGKHANVPFLHSARKNNKLAVETINSDEIAVVIPILAYNNSTGQQSVKGYGYLLYDMSSVAIDGGRTLSLYIQILFISLLVGFLFYFLIYKLFLYPIREINNQLDQQLQQGQGSDIALTFHDETLQKLISNINTTLNRSTAPEQPAFSSSLQDKSGEINGIIQIIGFPAIAFESNLTLAAFNPAAEDLLTFTADMIGFGTDKINDQALKLNIEDLLNQAQFSQGQLISNHLEINSEQHELLIQTVMSQNEVSYYIIALIPQEVGE